MGEWGKILKYETFGFYFNKQTNKQRTHREVLVLHGYIKWSNPLVLQLEPCLKACTHPGTDVWAAAATTTTISAATFTH